MRICEIHIGEFGGISNKKVVLDDGFNLICGENESGKSTLCGFIKYIFYGFSGSEERRDKSSFRTGISEGYVIIEDENGEKYRIERSDSERTRGRTGVFRESDGTELTDWKDASASPGEYFFGVNEKLYARSLYVSQESGAALDGGSAEAVSNLLISGDEATNLNKAKNALDAYRKSLRLKRGRGGKIADTEDRLSELRQRFDKGVKDKESLRETNAEIKKTENDIAEYESRIKTAEETLKKARAAKIIGLLNTQDKSADDKKALSAKELALTEHNTVNGFLPNGEYIRSLEIADAAVKAKEESLEKIRTGIRASEAERKSAVPKGYREYTEMGGKAALSERYRRTASLKRLFQLFTVFCFILAFASFISFFLADAFDIRIQRSTAFAAASTAAMFIFGGFFLVFCIKLRKLNKKLFINSKRPPAKAFGDFDAYEKSLGEGFGSMRKAESDAENEVKEKHNELNELLARWNKSSVSEAKKAFSEYRAAKEDIEKKKNAAENLSNRASFGLSCYSEDEVSEARALSFTASDAKEENLFGSVGNETHLNEELSKSNTELSKLRDKLRGLEIRRAEIRGGEPEDLARLSAEKDALEAELETMRFNYEAAELALTALGEAENSIRNTFSPYLSEKASEYFSALTQNRYPGLLLDESISLKYRDAEAGTPRESKYLSGGSADLAWICLRLALYKKLSEGRYLPLILDECFVYFDDTRLSLILETLLKTAKDGTQILLFSASSREKDILKNTVSTVLL